MANYAYNELYACMSERNIRHIVEFFENEWQSEVECDYAGDSSTCSIYFESKWGFPEEDMIQLYKGLPDKDDIYIRCLSTCFEDDYVGYYKCDERGWYDALAVKYGQKLEYLI